ncbi:MAG: hypothetical protein HYV24_04655 [Deltaproteobacteria bacterium]|nr:hypothetical protein [Deltaproteobacteria bacterium]
MADQRIQYTEELVGANHATKSDTINRLSLVEHNNDGTHKSANIYSDLVAKRPWVDVRAFGATGDGATDDTAAIQDAINYAAANGLNVYAPEGHYKFTNLYFHYHATSNPGWPQTAGFEGKLAFFGDGAVSGYNYANDVWKRTVLESTDATGPAIMIDGSGVGARLSNFKISGMSIIANNTTSVFDIDVGNYYFILEELFIGQKGAGGGILAEGIYTNFWRDVRIYGAGKTVSGCGLTVRSVAGQNGGGNNIFINVSTYNFERGWEIGHATYGSGEIITTVDCIGCEASTHKTYGVLVGHGAKNFNWIGSYIEKIQDGASGGIGMLVKHRAQCTLVKGSWFSDNDIGLQLGTNDADANQRAFDMAAVEGCNFQNILVDGVRKYSGLYSIGGIIRGNKFGQSASAPGATSGVWAEDAAHRGLSVEDNEFSTGLTTPIVNAHRVNVLKNQSANRTSVIKMSDVVSFAANDATPDVSDGRVFKTANTATTVITALDNGIAGQEAIIIFGDANTTVDFTGTNLKGNGGTDFTASFGDTMSAVFDGTNWYCAVANNT